ncbi:mRNA Hypothetical protein [Nesidiocoris tenuis]|uniref:RRM domain-containing protein n=1 Tax=Nesidiocoris tenuis TaxID=355587 RepID=A0ABN7AND7_9HEMI|nr:mRNA Hypothetical protein [Nesidiocoris tenuis]
MADADDLYICVSEAEGGSPVELPLEEDKTLLLSSLEAQFPGAVGLKFINPKTGVPRGVRRVENVFHPPTKEGWGDKTYICVFPKAQVVQAPAVEAAVPAPGPAPKPETTKSESTKTESSEPEAEKAKGNAAQPKKGKRKIENGDGNSGQPKTAKVAQPPTCDLIMLNLSPKTTEDQLRNYLEKKYGKVKKLQIKTRQNGGSRGFGFVKFLDYDHQRQVLRANHLINGSNVTFDIHDRDLVEKPTKLFVQDLTKNLTVDDIKEYFTRIGDVTDCFIPGKKLIAFVEFHDPNAAAFALGSHTIKGTTVRAKVARPLPGEEPQVFQKHDQRGNNAGYRDEPAPSGNRDVFQNNQRRDNNWGNQGPQDRWSGNFDQHANEYIDDLNTRGRNPNPNFVPSPTPRNLDFNEVNLLAAIKTGLEARTRKVVGNLNNFHGPPVDSRSDWHGGNKFQSYPAKNPSERFPSSGGRGRARTPPGEWDCPEPEDPFRNRHSDGYGAQSSHMRGSRSRFN